MKERDKKTIKKLANMLKKSLETMNAISTYNLQDRCEGVLQNANDWHKFEFINKKSVELNEFCGRKNIIKI